MDELAKRLERIGPHAVRSAAGFTLSQVPRKLEWIYEELGLRLRITCGPEMHMWVFYVDPASYAEIEASTRVQIVRNILEGLKFLNRSSAFKLETPDGDYFHPSY